MIAVGIVLLVVAGVLVETAARLRNRSARTPEGRQQQLSWIPVSEATQREALGLLREGKEATAIKQLRDEVPFLTIRQARGILQRLDEHPQPATYQEVVRKLQEEHPDLMAEVRRLAQRGSKVQAARELRRDLDLGLASAVNLVNAVGDFP